MNNQSASHQLPPLPFGENDLEPVISSDTLNFHYNKHHRGYVDNLNKLIGQTGYVGLPLEEIIRKSAQVPEQAAVFNNAAQAWNHAFYWQCIKPGGGGKPTGEIAERIDRELGGYTRFVEAFKSAGATQFGSGWAWLVLNYGELQIIKTANADTPIAHGLTPLLTVDVWEHAYYLDYQNRRPDYLTAFVEQLINWDFVNRQL
jgi:Fe-Mn family superoxide dismutase